MKASVRGELAAFLQLVDLLAAQGLPAACAVFAGLGEAGSALQLLESQPRRERLQRIRRVVPHLEEPVVPRGRNDLATDEDGGSNPVLQQHLPERGVAGEPVV